MTHKQDPKPRFSNEYFDPVPQASPHHPIWREFLLLFLN